MLKKKRKKECLSWETYFRDVYRGRHISGKRNNGPTVMGNSA